jgi:hypothetical protein
VIVALERSGDDHPNLKKEAPVYVSTVVAVPAPGKAPAVEAMAREIVLAQQAAGARMALSVRIWSGPAALVARTVVPDMAGVTGIRSGAQRAEAQARLAQFSALLCEPLAVTLHQVLLPSPVTVTATVASFARVYPAIGKGPEVNAILQAEAKAEHELGISVVISRAAIATEGPMFTAATAYADLAAWEQTGQRLGADPRWQANIQQVGPLLRRPIETVMEELLLPFPP